MDPQRAPSGGLLRGRDGSARARNHHQNKPNLILTDIGLPDNPGLEPLKDIGAIQPDVPVLVISMHDEMLYVERVLRARGGYDRCDG